MSTTEPTLRGSRTFWRPGDGKSHLKARCIRCGIERKYSPNRKDVNQTGLCRDCRSVDPTFGQPVQEGNP